MTNTMHGQSGAISKQQNSDRNIHQYDTVFCDNTKASAKENQPSDSLLKKETSNLDSASGSSKRAFRRQQRKFLIYSI